MCITSTEPGVVGKVRVLAEKNNPSNLFVRKWRKFFPDSAKNMDDRLVKVISSNFDQYSRKSIFIPVL